MLELLQNVSRVVLAMASGVGMIVGFAFIADALTDNESGEVWKTAADMYDKEAYRWILILTTFVAAYLLGIVNFASSNLLFNLWAKRVHNELIIVSRIEPLNQPQVMKEMLDLLHVKRSLIAFSIPLVVFGIGLALDKKQWKTPGVAVWAGVVVLGAGLLSFFVLAVRLAYHIEEITDQIVNEKPLMERKPDTSAEQKLPPCVEIRVEVK